MSANVARIGKAVMATAVAALGSLNVALADNQLTAKELIESAIVALAALGATYAVPNAPQSTPADPETFGHP